MKTRIKCSTRLGALISLALLFSCEKNELEPAIVQAVTEESGAEALKSYNNGMIKSYSNATVMAWNEAIRAVENKMPPPAEARIYTLVSLAMHDALNAVVPRYEAYAQNNSGVDASGVSRDNITPLADAAVSQAAYEVLVALFPGAKPLADNLLASSLAGISDPDLKAQGTDIGHAAAAALFAKRQGDLPLVFTTFNLGDDPGVFQTNYMPWLVANPPVWPQNAAYAVNLGNMEPFGMASADQFRAVPPYGINTPAYTADYDEVKRLGCTACPDRTAEQTEIGAFWVENVSSSMNRVARAMAQSEKLDGWEAARLFALLHITQMDANIGSFEGKYHYNYWRPITAIRAGDTDGNDQTVGDVTWTPTFTTPPTPDYPSTHAYTGGAGSELLKLYFGRDKISFTAVSPYYLPGVERTYTSFTQIGHENALSRIYIGYHFRKAVEEGEKMGRQLGSYIFRNSLPLLKNKK
jgi:hypothetical protein